MPQPVKCRHAECSVMLIWLPTKTGRHMPVEADSIHEGDTIYDSQKHHEHWSRCPGAKGFRRDARVKEQS
jgi:hypothetical protein